MFNIRSIFPSGRRLLKRRPTRADRARDDDADSRSDDRSQSVDEEEVLPVPQPRHRGGPPSPDVPRMREDGRGLEGELRKLREDYGELEKVVEDLRRKLDRAKEQAKVQTERLEEEVALHHHTRDLLKSRALELKDAEAALSKVDFSEIIGMVEALNQEVQHASSLLADAFHFERPPEDGAWSREMEAAYEQSRKNIGSKIVRLLESRNHHEDRRVVVIALHANISACCKRIISPEYFDESRYGRFLTEMCRGIRRSEEQTAFGKWRAVSGHQFRRMRKEWKFTPEEDLKKDILYHIIDIVVLAGSKEERSAMQNTAVSTLEGRLNKIVQLVFELNRAAREEVLTGDLEATVIPPKTRFHPGAMDTAYGESTSDRETVLCCTDIGLNEYAKRSGSQKEREGEERSSSRRYESSMLLKPKVVLVSAVERPGRHAEDEKP